MIQGLSRTLVRWVHIVFSVPIIGYVYSPFDEIPKFAHLVRFIFLPLLVVSGLWLWKGHWLRRLFVKRPA